jgi:sigma-B regulation protein RsbQ
MLQRVLSRHNVQQRGQGARTLVFVHGYGCDQRMWRFVAPAFEADHRVVLLDLVGAGGSDVSAFDPARHGSLEGYAQDLVEVCDALELEGATLVGHSVSAMIAALASLRAPRRVGALVLVAPSPCYLNHPPDYHGGFERRDLDELLALLDANLVGWADALAPTIMGNPEQPERTRELRDSFCSLDPTIARVFARATFYGDNRADARAVAVPSLIMQCASDAIAPAAVGRWLHANMAGSELRTLRATGHCPHMTHPAETIAVLRAYLDAGHRGGSRRDA